MVRSTQADLQLLLHKNTKRIDLNEVAMHVL